MSFTIFVIKYLINCIIALKKKIRPRLPTYASFFILEPIFEIRMSEFSGN